MPTRVPGCRAGGDHVAARFVAGGERISRVGHLTTVMTQMGAADAGGADSHQHLVPPRSRLGAILESNVGTAVEHCRLHRRRSYSPMGVS